MREIKFRVWDKDEKIIKDDHDAKWALLNCMYEPYDQSRILMQFTGLKDKNGVEIFEGDIIEFSFIDNSTEKEILPVMWDDMSAGFVCRNTKHAKGIDMAGNYDSIKGFIIGNIYQNPKLLKL